MSRSADISRAIACAFGDATPPKDTAIVYDNSQYHDECVEVRTILRGRKWTDIDVAIALRLRQALFFLTPEAIVYYLPGFMCISLLAYDQVDTVPAEVVFALSPESLDATLASDVASRKFALVTSAQAKVVCMFLRTLSEEHADDFPNDRVLTSAIQLWCATSS